MTQYRTMTPVQLFNQILRSRRSVFPDQFDAGKELMMPSSAKSLTNAACARPWKISQPWRLPRIHRGWSVPFAQLIGQANSISRNQAAGSKASYIKMQQESADRLPTSQPLG